MSMFVRLDFGFDYQSPPADWSLSRVRDPAKVAFFDITRRLTTRPGVIWWTSRPVDTTSDELEPSLDLRDIPLDSGSISGLGAAIVQVVAASPFVDVVDLPGLNVTPNGDVSIAIAAVLLNNVRLRLSAQVDVESGAITWTYTSTVL